MIDLLIRLSISIFTMATIVILTFSMFRIPIINNDKQIIFISLIVGSLNYYLKFVVDTPLFFMLQNVAFITILIIIRKYPFFYAFIVCFTGVIVISIVDGALTFQAVNLGWTTMEKVVNDTEHFVVSHLVVSIVYLLLSYIIYKFKLGFSFIVRRFSGKNFIKSHNFIWAFLLIAGSLVLHFGIKEFDINSLHSYIIAVLALILSASLFLAYRQNKLVKIDRYGGSDIGE